MRNIGLCAGALAAFDRAIKETGLRGHVLLPWWIEWPLYGLGLAAILMPVFKAFGEFVPATTRDVVSRLARDYLWNATRGPIAWEPYQLNCTGHEGGAVYVAQFNIAGTVKRGPIQFSEAYVVSLVTGERRPALIDTEPGYRAVDQTEPIPANSIVRLKVLFYNPALSVHPEGQTEATFMAGWRHFAFLATYGRYRCRIEVSQDEVMASIDAARTRPHQGPPLPKPIA